MRRYLIFILFIYLFIYLFICLTSNVYASYQHAVKNISLNDSMNYTFSYNGLGGVSLFNNSSLFDKMQELKRVFSKFLKSNKWLLFKFATICCLK